MLWRFDMTGFVSHHMEHPCKNRSSDPLPFCPSIPASMAMSKYSLVLLLPLIMSLLSGSSKSWKLCKLQKQHHPWSLISWIAKQSCKFRSNRLEYVNKLVAASRHGRGQERVDPILTTCEEPRLMVAEKELLDTKSRRVAAAAAASRTTRGWCK
jgi:hypothetical protein